MIVITGGEVTLTSIYRRRKESVIKMASTAVRPSGRGEPGRGRPAGGRPQQQRPNPQYRGGPQSQYQQQRQQQPYYGGSRSPQPQGRRKKKSKAPLIITVLILLIIIIVAVVYGVGYLYYKDRFTANVFINGREVSGNTMAETRKMFEHKEVPEDITIATPRGNSVKLSLAEVDYKFSYEEELDRIYADLDKKSWFAYLLHRTDYNFSDVSSYNKDKLMSAIDSADWGTQENVNAQLKSDDNGFHIEPEVQGDVFDMGVMKNFIATNLDKDDYSFDAMDSGAYVQPDTVAADYEAKAATLNNLWNMSISYDFNYTEEELTGKQIIKLVDVDREGNYTVDEEACMTYIEKLAKKYDTYNTVRKFKSTLQGKIKVNPSSDAKYGWWMDQQQSCDQLVRMLKKGKTRKNVTPIYYVHDGYFEFTGVPEARTEKDDIGKTYIEVDLSNQQWWYYKKGKKKRHGYIVSGQTTTAARTTLEGVYKLWAKDVNHRMKDRNADGDEWDVTCNYWNNISLCGIGMHDSTWRGGFGGDIYKYNGSHGCINMTYDDAQYIYNNIPLGTPVVMFY